MIVDGSDRVCLSIISNRLWDDNVTGIITMHHSYTIFVDVVADAVDFKIIG